MLETSARLLRLLSLLQMHRDWTGAVLADRLGVTPRTIRRDMEKLRDLGYPIHASTGITGGYRLGAGAAMPPLLLDDDEAVAVAVGLRQAAGGAVTGIEETSVRALAKLEQVLPSRLRRRVNALQSYTVPVTMPGPAQPTGDPEVLTTLAAACRDHERLSFDYRSYDGTASRRRTEPHRMVTWGRRWYLLAWDLDREDWRTYRVDRITPKTPAGPRFTPRELPSDDVARYVSDRVSEAGWRYRIKLRVHASAEHVRERVPPAYGRIEPVDDGTCLLSTGADTLESSATYLGLLAADFDVLEPPELREHLRVLGERFGRASASADPLDLDA